MKKNQLLALGITLLVLIFPFRWAYLDMELPMMQRLAAFLFTLIGFGAAGILAGVTPQKEVAKVPETAPKKAMTPKYNSDENYITAH